MKKFKIFTVIILLITTLISCENRIPVEPFIITEISISELDANRYVYKYKSEQFETRTGKLSSYTRYKIGDTISLKQYNKNE